jgi:hypothetical protein
VQEGGGDTKSTSRTTCGSFIIGIGPGILAEIFENPFQQKTAFRDGTQKSFQDFLSGSTHNRSLALLSSLDLTAGATEEFPHTAGSILTISTQNIGLADRFRRQIIDRYVGTKGNETDERIGRQKVQGLLE